MHHSQKLALAVIFQVSGVVDVMFALIYGVLSQWSTALCLGLAGMVVFTLGRWLLMAHRVPGSRKVFSKVRWLRHETRRLLTYRDIPAPIGHARV
jgi:hypothetical protein